MKAITLDPISRIEGEINLPGSKSLSNRALLLAALAKGTTTVTNLLDSDDIRHMLNALKALGVNPLHFGVIFIVNIMIGGLTPPFGSMMFTVCSIVGVRLGGFIKEVWPFIVALIVVLFIVTYSESIALFIPNLLR